MIPADGLGGRGEATSSNTWRQKGNQVAEAVISLVMNHFSFILQHWFISFLFIQAPRSLAVVQYPVHSGTAPSEPVARTVMKRSSSVQLHPGSQTGALIGRESLWWCVSLLIARDNGPRSGKCIRFPDGETLSFSTLWWRNNPSDARVDCWPPVICRLCFEFSNHLSLFTV